MTEPEADWLSKLLHDRRGEEFELHRQFVSPGFVKLLQTAGYGRRFVRARGLELEDEHGRRFLDFVSGFGVLNLGYNHPRIRQALRAALDAELPGYAQVDCPLVEGLAAESLASLFPGDLSLVYFCNSGADAVDAGLKLARAVTGRRRTVCCEGGYHGLTLGSLALNGDKRLRKRFRPLLPDVDRVPFGDLAALAAALGKNDVAAFVVEPIQGEGGCVVPPPGYLSEALALCRVHGTLFVLDEVQTGLGRTGEMFALENEQLLPDAVAVAKALGGGLMPVAALVAREDHHLRAYGSPQRCHDHATTFGGGPLAMAAVLATLRVLEEEQWVARAAEQGDKLRRKLVDLSARHRSIREIRGRGLMLGIKFEDVTRGALERTLLRGVGQTSSYLFVQSVCLRLLDEHGIVAQSAVNDAGVLKVMPPLTVTDEAIDHFVEALDAVLGQTGHVSALAHLARAVLERGGRS